MNQCCADEGENTGMSPGGNNCGISTLITFRARPRSLKATGQSCQSISHTGKGGALGLRSRWRDAEMRGLTPGGSDQSLINVRQELFLALVTEATGSPCKSSSATASPGLQSTSSVRVSLIGTSSIFSIHPT